MTEDVKNLDYGNSGGAMEKMTVPPAQNGSIEDILHQEPD